MAVIVEEGFTVNQGNDLHDVVSKKECVFFRGMVLSGIPLESKTDLVIVAGLYNGRARTLTTFIYIEEILVNYVVPYSGFIGDNFHFMLDNAIPQKLHAVTEYREEFGILVIKWPPRGPDMNPIEH